MSRRLAVVAAALAVALGGCGGDDDRKSESPLGEALGYLPENAAAVVVLETSPEHAQWEQVDDLIQKFAVAPQIRQEGKNRIVPEPLDFDEDLGPQLGNELVVGVPEPMTRDDDDNYVVAVKVKNPTAAKGRLVNQLEQAGLEAQVDGDVLVASPERPLIDAAIEQAKGGDGLTEERFEEHLGRLGEGEPLLRATGDLTRRPKESAAAAAAIPWLGSLQRFAAVGRAQPDGLAIDFDVKAERVDEKDLPFPPGPASPPVPRREGEIAVAAREPGRSVGLVYRLRDFIPRTKAHAAALNDALKRIDVDIQRDLIGRIGDVGAASFPLDKTYVARADLKDPKAFADTLAKLARELPGAARGDVGFTIEPGGGEGFYRLNADRGRQLFLGVTGDQVALGEEAGRARDFAEEEAVPVPGARGSLAFAADMQSVANAIIEREASGTVALFGQLATEPLGDLRGWAETTPTGMSGHAELKIE